MRRLKPFLVVTPLLLWAILAVQASELPGWANAIDAGTMATVSDGDHVARTYVTGRLAPPDAGHRDWLTILKRTTTGWSRSRIEVSNSVTAAPEVLRLTRDGQTAFVTERLAPRHAGATLSSELRPGRHLFAIDLSQPDAPRLADSVFVESFPEALAVRPDGRAVAVVSNTPEASFLQIATFDGRRFGVVHRFRLDELGVTGTARGPRAGVNATNVDWHPSGGMLAVNLNTLNQVAFFRVRLEDGQVLVEASGRPVTVGPDPFVGRFTPDGRHYLTADWGRNFAATSLEDRLPRHPSAVSVIRLAAPTDQTPDEHRRIGGATTDLSSEGIAISPDGRMVATVNMRGTALDPGSARFDRQASVSLLRLDPDTGSLTKVADYPFEGVLPEGGTFDLSGAHFLATVFEYHDGLPAGGGVEVFRVRKDGPPALVRLGRLALPHGVHHVDVAR